ncbi:class C sortase [Vagococcus sp. BWB3-3]|uniref:Class C sortase n=1 Tax=Vagococcus allomyrinae TaxID=2794353 RepID=A0A940SW12_9ENTE|nr:class C sortase [Vagococcus allomyrinae]MBP1042479.1 class C sortase [Vagococcus allomyrinae]
MANKRRIKKKRSRKTIKKKKWVDLFFLAVVLAGVGLLLYPIYSDYQLKRSQTMEIRKYQATVSNLSKEEKEQKLAEYEKKNEDQKQGNVPLDEPFANIEGQSSNSLNLKEQSLPEPVAVLDIPKIDLEVQVYPTSSDLVLEKGVGVLEGTAIPSGGMGNHSVLTGHRGLSLGQMFTDLPNLKVNDHFYLTILGEVHAYEIDQIKTITPDDLSHFDRDENEDYITLVTCTPLGINSHRLLVRGHRIPYIAKEKDAKNYWTMKTFLIIGIGCILLVMLILIGVKKCKKRKAGDRRSGQKK